MTDSREPAKSGLRITVDSALDLPFADWRKVFDSTTVAAVIADRLVFRSKILSRGAAIGKNTAIRQSTTALGKFTLMGHTLNAPSRPQ